MMSEPFALTSRACPCINGGHHATMRERVGLFVQSLYDLACKHPESDGLLPNYCPCLFRQVSRTTIDMQSCAEELAAIAEAKKAHM